MSAEFAISIYVETKYLQQVDGINPASWLVYNASGETLTSFKLLSI